MGNTPLQSKRRLSGDMDAYSCENTPPHIAVDIPAKRRTLCDSSSYPHSAPVDCPFDKLQQDGQLAVDNMAWLLHGASLQDGYTAGPSRPTSLAVEPASGPDTVTNSHERRPIIVNPSAVCSDVEMTPTAAAPPQKLLPTVFRWNGGGNEVYISGTFNDWHSRIPLVRRNSGACVIVDCPPGKHEYKFFIDGAWYHDPTKPTVDNRYGTKNNVVEVKESDFDFLNAIEQDIANSKHKTDTSSNSDYVDDTFVIIERSRLADFQDQLNGIFPDIQFTREEEHDEQRPFLDVLVTRTPNGELNTTVSRKATNTTQILNYHSNHPMAHKRSCVRTLFSRVKTHCSEPEGRVQELRHLRYQLARNGYPSSFVGRCLRTRPRRTDGGEPPTLWHPLPYIKNVSEEMERIAGELGVGIAHRPQRPCAAKSCE
ncbi:5'-AMP-activated protein kinase subunit beta-2 [Sparganum proliferum]